MTMITLSDAPGVGGPISARQLRFLTALGVEVPAGTTRGAATGLIDAALGEGRRPDPAFYGDGPPTDRQAGWLARQGLRAKTARGAAALIDVLPKPPPRPPVSDLVMALVTHEPFEYGIAELASNLGRGPGAVSAAVRRLEAEGRVTVRLGPGARKLVGVAS